MSQSQKQLFFYPSIKITQLPAEMQEELRNVYKNKERILNSIVKSQDAVPVYRKNRRIFLEHLIVFFIENTSASKYLLRYQEFNFYVYLMLGLKLLYPKDENISFSKTKGGGVGVLTVIRQSIERWKMLNQEHYDKLVAKNRCPQMDFNDFKSLYKKYTFELNNILYLFTEDFFTQPNVRITLEYRERMYYLVGLLKEYTNLDELHPNPYEQIYNIKEKIQENCSVVCPDFNIAGGVKNSIKMLLYAYNQFDDSIPLYEITDYRGRGRFESQKHLQQQLLEMQNKWQNMANKIDSLEQDLRILKDRIAKLNQ